MGWSETDALPCPGTPHVFDARHAPTFKKDRNTTQHTRFFVTSLTAIRGGSGPAGGLGAGQWQVEKPKDWRRDALWGEDQCRLRSKNAAFALTLLRTALLRLVLRCASGPTKTLFERVAARPPGHGLALLAKCAFP